MVPDVEGIEHKINLKTRAWPFIEVLYIVMSNQGVYPQKGVMKMSSFDLSPLSIPRISAITDPQLEAMKENSAEEYVKRLVSIMNEYNERLEHARQVALILVHFGPSMTFNVTNIGYWNPGLIIYYGTSPDGSPIELVQHISQIGCLLTSVPREDPSKPKTPIGFITLAASEAVAAEE